MKCPQCQKESRVYETRQRTENTLRRRECLFCKARFATLEIFDGMTGSRGDAKKLTVKKTQPPKEKKQPAVQPKVITAPRKPLVKDDLDIFYKDSVDFSDLGLDVGRGWRDEEY
jgi:transcriptional regulator NrdR family protein